jgi:hypothetical protein
VGVFGEAKARGVNCDQTDTLLVAFAEELVPNKCLGLSLFGAYKQCQEGILTHEQLRFSISSAQVCALERIPLR